jgi:hypothetical protein
MLNPPSSPETAHDIVIVKRRHDTDIISFWGVAVLVSASFFLHRNWYMNIHVASEERDPIFGALRYDMCARLHQQRLSQSPKEAVLVAGRNRIWWSLLRKSSNGHIMLLIY